MRILHYLSEVTLVHGGVVRSVLDISKGLASRGHAVTLACFDDTSVPPEWKAGAGGGLPRAITLAWPGLPKPVRRFGPAEVRRLADEIAACDVVHLHGPWESTNVQIAEIARKVGRPYVVSTHGMMDDWCMAQGAMKKRFYVAWRTRPMLEGAARVLFTAEGEKMQGLRWCPGAASRAEVLPLLFDFDDFRDLPGAALARERFEPLRTDGPIVLFLSRLHPKKGVETLIDACSILKREQFRFRLIIAGTGEASYEEALKRRAIDSGLSDRTYFLGMVTGREKVSLFEAADVSVLPTSQENWGFVILESLAAGTPVVTTKGVDIWPELQAGGGTLITEPGPHSVADGVRELLEHPERAASMGLAGREWVTNWLEPASVLERYEGMYGRCLR